MASLTLALLLGLAAASRAGVTLAAVGDISLDGPVGRIIALHGPGAPLAGLGDLLAADIVFGNLECPVTERGEKAPKTWNFRAPAKRLEALTRAGFQVLNLANNHIMDYGATGLRDTLAAVDKAGFLRLGAGRDLAEAERLLVVERGGLRIGFLGFTSTFPQEAWARKKRPGVAYSDFDRFPAVIREAKARCDVLIVSFHGGTELAPEPNDIQKDFAKVAITAGADLLIGHHPHVLQPVEIIDGKPVLYSLGNFLFVSPTPETRWTAVVRARLGPRGVEQLELAPVDIQWGRPRPADAEGTRLVYEALNRLGAFDQHPDLLSFRRSPP